MNEDLRQPNVSGQLTRKPDNETDDLYIDNFSFNKLRTTKKRTDNHDKKYSGYNRYY